MQSLVIRRGFHKRATEQDGPSFEQQFGILTNAVISDKFPSLDSMKLAFQLIEKNDQNNQACGVAVYQVGKNIIFVPSFFKNNKLRTGDIMFLAQTQQFLPLSDPWLAWLKNKDLNDVGEQVPAAFVDVNTGVKGTTIRDMSDPILKTASVYIRGLLHTEPDMKKRVKDASLLDTALCMGKEASQVLLDNLIKNTNFLNASLAFYSGDELDTFAKKASELAEPEKTIELILPLDKAAKTLNSHELKALYKDGFFIRKKAAEQSPDVIRSRQLKGMFQVVKSPGKYKMLRHDGSVGEELIFQKQETDISDAYSCCCDCYEQRSKADPGVTAAKYMHQNENTGDFITVDGQRSNRIPRGAMCMGEPDKITPQDLQNVGNAFTEDSIKEIPWGSIILAEDGKAYALECEYTRTDDKSGWLGTGHGSLGKSIKICHDTENKLTRPMVLGKTLILPEGTRILFPDGYRKNGERDNRVKDTNDITAPVSCDYVTFDTLEAFLVEYCNKLYHKARIYHNGSEYVVSGDLSNDDSPKNIKEAAMMLVQDYDLDPTIAKVMLKEACNGATYDHPKSSVYYITKKAEEVPSTWQDATIPMDQIRNKPPQIRQETMPTVIEDPAQLQQAILAAAQAGIKEVFDITALKLLVRQAHFFDEIQEDLPMFMQVLDSLCRKLFQFYWHTDKMADKYGVVKLKALEESLKCAIDSLSELTIFFKLRTVDGSRTTGDSAGELMSGNMM